MQHFLLEANGLMLFGNVGLSQVMDSNLFGFGQCGDVELEIGVLGTTVPGAAAVSEGFHTIHVVERRVSHP